VQSELQQIPSNEQWPDEHSAPVEQVPPDPLAFFCAQLPVESQ
jgi:hypothetical protein